MEVNTDSAVNSLPDTIGNIIFEFHAQPGSNKVSESEDVVISQSTGDQVTHVVFCPPVSHNNPGVSHNDSDVSAQISSTNDVYSSSTTQETSRSNVVEQIKNCVAKRTTLRTSMSKSKQPSISKPQQPSISKPRHAQSINLSKPSMIRLRIQNGQVVQNIHYVDIHATQADQQEKTAHRRPNEVEKPANTQYHIQYIPCIDIETQVDRREKTTHREPPKKVEKPGNNFYTTQVIQNIHDVDIQTQRDLREETTNRKPPKKVEIPANNSSKQMDGPQIHVTSSTKLALLNFLKKKSAGNISETSSYSGGDDDDTEVKIISTVREANNASEEDTTCSDLVSSSEKEADPINVPTRTESQVGPEIISIAESSSPGRSNENPDQSPVELMVAEVQSNDADQLSTQQSDVAGLNAESDKHVKHGDNYSSSISTEESCAEVENTTSDVGLRDKFTTTVQEVDVVVLPSLMQPDVTKQAVKRSGKVPQQETGIKKKKTTKPRECQECGKMLSSSAKYSNHMNIHYDRRPFNCNECGKSFRQRQHLSKHKLIHTGEKPYICKYCDKAFLSRYNLRDHERIHTGEKPCKCPHCDEMFRCSTAVKDHEKNVHNLHLICGNLVQEKKIYTCKVCDKTFSSSSALSTHKKRHIDVRGYKCNKCSKTFKNNSELWNHKRTHSKERPFQCDLCGQRLKRRGNLKRHILAQHKAEEAEECLKTSKQFEHLRAKNAK